MTKTWRRATTQVSETLQRAAHLGPRWARDFCAEAAASGLRETPTPETIERLIRAAVVLLDHRLSDAEAARENRRQWVTRLRRRQARRAEAAKDAHDLLVSGRRFVLGLFGEVAGRDLFPSGSTPYTPEALLRWGRSVVEKLEVVAPAPGLVSSADVGRLVESLTQSLARLATTQAEFSTGKTAADRALVVRNQALVRLRRAQSGVNRLLEAFETLTDLSGSG